jgi:hypothetical protein
MPDESDLRDLMQSTSATPRSINAAVVIRRSRMRRMPKQVGLEAAATLAIGGIGIASVQGIASLGSSTASSTAADTASLQEAPEVAAGSAPDDMMSGGTAEEITKRAPADKLNLCGGPLAEVAPSATGLVATVEFAGADAGQERVDGVVTLTNTSSVAITGSTSATPAITLSQGGIVLWHSNGPTIAMVAIIDLAPGASMRLPASFEPVICAVDDDLLESFRADLPAAPPGDYQVSAALDVLVDQGAGSLELVTGPASATTLR